MSTHEQWNDLPTFLCGCNVMTDESPYWISIDITVHSPDIGGAYSAGLALLNTIFGGKDDVYEIYQITEIDHDGDDEAAPAD